MKGMTKEIGTISAEKQKKTAQTRLSMLMRSKTLINIVDVACQLSRNSSKKTNGLRLLL